MRQIDRLDIGQDPRLCRRDERRQFIDVSSDCRCSRRISQRSEDCLLAVSQHLSYIATRQVDLGGGIVTQELWELCVQQVSFPGQLDLAPHLARLWEASGACDPAVY